MKAMTPTRPPATSPPPRAGRAHRQLFTDDAVALIHQAARGKPRAVNNISTQP